MDQQVDKTQCPTCLKHFSTPGGRNVHVKGQVCQQPRRKWSSSLRRRCELCNTNRTKCDLERPQCTRCRKRGVPCEYPTPAATSAPGETNGVIPSPSLDTDPAPDPGIGLSGLRQGNEGAPPDPNPASLRTLFTGYDNQVPLIVNNPLLGSPDPSEALDSKPLLRDGGEVVGGNPGSLHRITPAAETATSPALEDHRLENHRLGFVFRLLRTWPKMLAGDFQIPPLFHPTQVASGKPLPKPLANCFALVYLWHRQVEGAQDMVRKIILAELDSVLEKFTELDDPTLSAVLQSVVIYTIILLFPSPNSQPTPPHETFFPRIEQLVHHVVSTGLVLPEEQNQTQPSWNSWVQVTSKRRAVLALYLLQWASSVFHGGPSFNCPPDLGLMPAPTAKVLWQASTEQEWKTRYREWSVR